MKTHIASDTKSPENMTRKEKMEFIRYLYAQYGLKDAQTFWLCNCPKVSRAVFLDLIR